MQNMPDRSGFLIEFETPIALLSFLEIKESHNDINISNLSEIWLGYDAEEEEVC